MLLVVFDVEQAEVNRVIVRLRNVIGLNIFILSRLFFKRGGVSIFAVNGQNLAPFGLFGDPSAGPLTCKGNTVDMILAGVIRGQS